jgi:hypothetical protein
MLKSSERKHTTPPANQPCFETSEQPQSPGISFEMKGGTKRFALHSFLSAVDFDGSGALILRYTFGTITVKGKALQPLWEAVCQGTLSRVREGAATSPEGLSVDTIAMVDFAETLRNEPVFPEDVI